MLCALLSALAWASPLPAPLPPRQDGAPQDGRALVGTHGSERPAPPAPTGSPAFRIGGEEVSADAYGRWLLAVLGEREARAFALDWVVEREARRLGVKVADADVEAALDEEVAIRVQGAFVGERQAWIDELRRTGRSEGEFRTARKAELEPMLDAIAIASVDRVVPERKIVREWQLHHGRNGRRYDLRMLLLRVVQEMPPDGTPYDERMAGREERKAERRAEALALRRRALDGEDFGRLCAEASDDEETRANGGRPPEGFVHFGWPPAFLDALEEVPVGEISEPLYAKGGWWLVEVEDVHVTPLESVRDELTADLVARGPESDEVGALQERLMQDVEVEVLPGAFAAPRGDEPDAWEVALRIDGEPVPRSEYALWLLHARGSSWNKRFIEDWLIEREARAAGIEVSDEDVARRAAEMFQWRVEDAHHGDRGAYLAYLAARDLDEEKLLRSLGWRARADLMAEALLLRDRVVTEDELRRAWIDRYGADGASHHVRSLAIAIDPGPGAGLEQAELERRTARAREETRARAEDVVRRLANGEDFAVLAERLGDPHPPEGIRAASSRFRPETWPEHVAAAVGSLEPGQATPPILFEPYWMVFECTRIERVAFDDVREELLRERTTRRPVMAEIATYRNVLYEAADPEVLPGMYE